MLRLHVLGHVYASREQRPLQLPGKSVALLTYLALEGRPHHREHLAGLLWDTPDALRNLRVELTRLKGREVDLFPARQPMLTLRCATDLEDWLGAPEPTLEDDVTGWLSRLRGPALSGLEDMGSSEFRTWVDHQRRVIHDRIEERLQLTHARLERQGQSSAAGLVQARAEVLGLHLCSSAPPVHATALQFEWPMQEQQMRQVLAQAEHHSQLALLHGHSGTRRDMLRRVVHGTPWTAVQVRVAARQSLLQAVLIQNVLRAMSPEQRAQQPAAHSQDAEQQLIRLGQLMSDLDRPLLVALHDVSHASELPAWLMSMLKFMLDLPVPLMLVLTTTSATVASSLRPVVAQLGGMHTHTITLPPLSVPHVVWAMEGQETPVLCNTRRARATRLVQRSEGLPLYVRALLREPASAFQGDARLPPEVRDQVLSELAHLPTPLQENLARLAQIYGRFDPAVARALLGEAAPEVLRAASQAGLLLSAEATETLILPELTYRSSDNESHLTFASEVTRSALAATLPAAERHALRATLAALLVPTHPELGLLYALRAGLTELVNTARNALPVSLGPKDRRAPTPGVLVGEPSTLPHVRRELRTPNGYRVALDGGWLEVLRRGPPGPPPLLILTLPGPGPGHWQLTARVDVAGGAAPPDLLPAPFVLGLRVGAGPRVIYAQEPVPDHPAEDTDQKFGGVVPLGHWFSLRGQGGSGPLELSVRAVDVALTVGDLHWGEHRLTDLCRAAFLQEDPGAGIHSHSPTGMNSTPSPSVEVTR